MHERTQRALARLMFVLCCALPTLVTLGIILVTWTPWYHHRSRIALESRLGEEMGLVVRIADFARLSPYALTLSGVELSEPETGRPIAQVRLAEWATSGGRSALRLSQPQVQSEQLSAFWALVHDRFLCQPQRTREPMRVHVDDLTIASRHGQPMSFRRVHIQLQPQARGVRLAVEAVQAHAPDDAPITLQLFRDRAGDTPATKWSLQTGAAALPCSALADFSPLIQHLGPDAEFSGNLEWELSADKWQLNLHGSHFRKLDLSRMFETLPHRLTGLADVDFNRGFIQPGKRIDVDGALVARDGNIGGSLVRAAHQWLQFEVAQDAISQHNLPYDRLALHFSLNGAQLFLTGQCAGEPGYESAPPGVALCADGRALARSMGQLLPSANLATAVAPEHSVQVPLSQQTASMLNLLLLPSRPLPVEGDGNTRARITRANPWTGERPIVQPRISGLDRPLGSP